MYLLTSVFENFRNIENFSFAFDKTINIIFGKNAQGKTNVVEGVYLFAGGRSFRRAKDRDLLSYEKDSGQVSISYSDNERENKMSMRIFRENNRECFKNGLKIRRMSDFIGNFRAVLFCHEHLSIIKDDPAVRRNFLDGAISQIKPSYLSALIEYKKILEQRNALLKNYEKSPASFDMTVTILSEKLAENAAIITEERAKYLFRLFSLVGNYIRDMSFEKEDISYLYISSITEGNEAGSRGENREKYKKLLSENIEKEKAAGSTLYGIHRDDFEIMLDGRIAKIFASQGQQRSIALSLKLAEGDISKEDYGEYPVFLFDDVLSELDRGRKNYILKELDGRQTIITSCDESDFSGVLGATKIYVENGKYFYR